MGSEPADDALKQVLRKLLTHPQRRLFGSGQTGGLLPSRTPANRQLAQSLAERGFIRIRHIQGTERCEITKQGKQWLIDHEEPWILLEDLLTATERLQEKIDALLDVCQDQKETLRRQHQDICSVLETVFRSHPDTRATGYSERIQSLLDAYAAAGHSTSCSVDELYRLLRETDPQLTIGRFHDELRKLHEAGLVRFTPWTGPLYELPEPSLALLIGHEVLYYVQRCRTNAA